MYVCTYICYRLLLLEGEMQALEQKRGGGEKERFRSSKVISLLIMLCIHMPVPPPHQSIIFHVPTSLNPHAENPIENPRKVDYNKSFSRIDFSVRDRTDGWQPVRSHETEQCLPCVHEKRKEMCIASMLINTFLPVSVSLEKFWREPGGAC